MWCFCDDYLALSQLSKLIWALSKTNPLASSKYERPHGACGYRMKMMATGVQCQNVGFGARGSRPLSTMASCLHQDSLTAFAHHIVNQSMIWLEPVKSVRNNFSKTTFFCRCQLIVLAPLCKCSAQDLDIHTVNLHSAHDNGGLHGAGLGIAYEWDFVILLEYTGLLCVIWPCFVQ